MAHIAKYQAGALGNMCAHYDRWNGDLAKAAARDNIDPTKSHLNYNLAPKRSGQVAFIRERIESLHLSRIRKDAVRMCDCVLTRPKSLDPSRTEEFFRAGYEFLKDRYGGENAENVVSAYVHFDEPKGQPHMHFAFVPVTKDGRLSAKDIITRADLRTLHTDMKRFVESELGCEVEIILSDEKAGEKQLSHLKQDEYIAAKQRLEELDVETQQVNERLEYLRQRESGVRERISDLEEKLTTERIRILGEEYAKEAFESGKSAGLLESEAEEYERIARHTEQRRNRINERIRELRERIVQVRARISEVIRGDVSNIPREFIESLRHKLKLNRIRSINDELSRQYGRSEPSRGDWER